MGGKCVLLRTKKKSIQKMGTGQLLEYNQGPLSLI